MKVAFLAPLPPPRTGQSLCDETLLEYLQRHHTVTVIPTSKGELRQGAGTVAQLPTTVRQVARILAAVRKVRAAKVDVIYHSPSQTRIGNIKDLLLLAALGARRRSVVLHLHGGGFRPALAGNAMWQRLNRRLFGGVGAVIVLGPSLAAQLDGIVAPERISSVTNFAADELFVPIDSVDDRWAAPQITVLFIGSLFESKGWPIVASAARVLADRGETRVRFRIAGPAPEAADLAAVRAAAAECDLLEYLGELAGEERRAALAEAAIVAVPTRYPWEGQPLVILEAYASGAVVGATLHAGIADVFAPGENGFVLDGPSPEELADAIIELLENREGAERVGRHNREMAEQFRSSAFVRNVEQVLLRVAS
jgi:glycosyltransferase involved in cell wall biosynthesis